MKPGANPRYLDLPVAGCRIDTLDVMTYDQCNQEPSGKHVCHRSRLVAGRGVAACIDATGGSARRFARGWER